MFVGDSGGEMGVHGWVAALDEKTGKLLWRAYSTGPDTEVLIGPDFKPHYAGDRGKDLGVASWPAAGMADRRRRGVGMAHLRRRAQLALHGHRQPRALES